MDAKIEDTIRKTLEDLIKQRSRHVIALTQQKDNSNEIDHRDAITNIQKEIMRVRRWQ
jgi:hypothetical protein